MELRIAQSTTYIFRKVSKYDFWADVTIRSWKGGGSIAIEADHGTFINSWNATGTDDIRKFLIKLQYDYFMGKAAHDHGYVTDWEATAQEVKRDILQSRRDGDISQEKARECWDSWMAVDHDEGFYWQIREHSELYDFVSRGDFPTKVKRSSGPDGFWTYVWPEIVAVWTKELEEASKEEAVPA